MSTVDNNGVTLYIHMETDYPAVELSCSCGEWNTRLRRSAPPKKRWLRRRRSTVWPCSARSLRWNDPMTWRTPAALVVLMDTRDQILRALADAMTDRNLRQYRHETGKLGWVLFERDTLRDAVVERRAGRGLEPVTSANIEALEPTRALGWHWDTRREDRCR
jgi:hypothetical protein